MTSKITLTLKIYLLFSNFPIILGKHNIKYELDLLGPILPLASSYAMYTAVNKMKKWLDDV